MNFQLGTWRGKVSDQSFASLGTEFLSGGRNLRTKVIHSWHPKHHPRRLGQTTHFWVKLVATGVTTNLLATLKTVWTPGMNDSSQSRKISEVEIQYLGVRITQIRINRNLVLGLGPSSTSRWSKGIGFIF